MPDESPLREWGDGERSLPLPLPLLVPESFPRGVPESFPRGVPESLLRGVPEPLPRGGSFRSALDPREFVFPGPGESPLRLPFAELVFDGRLVLESLFCSRGGRVA